MKWKPLVAWTAGQLVDENDMNSQARNPLLALKESIYPPACGRITLNAGVPVTTADVVGSTSVYYTPYLGNWIGVFDGTFWQIMAFTELSLPVTAGTPDTNYDLFIGLNSGGIGDTLNLDAEAWLSNSARNVGITTLDGVPVKGPDHTRRFLGTYRLVGASAASDSALFRCVWNQYNQVPRVLGVRPTADSWTYTAAAFRVAAGETANSVDVVVGQLGGSMLSLHASHSAQNSAGVTILSTSIGENSTTTPATGTIMRFTGGPTGQNVGMSAILHKYPPLGYSKYSWLEYSTATGTTTWYGDAGSAAVQNGLSGWINA